ncbi:hypothetical protein ABQX22_04175 [Xanthomonas sp. WHRI 1810A]|uniref:hypothetical protein n=1 Tax=Xanthomonas sp. WHRI 1810A TaxID=3161565 RepID=UPI0032E89126
MSTNDRNLRPDLEAAAAGLTTDTSGKPVDVVERDVEDTDEDTRSVDEVLTPTSTRAKEQDAETLKQKTAEIERKVADGN